MSTESGGREKKKKKSEISRMKKKTKLPTRILLYALNPGGSKKRQQDAREGKKQKRKDVRSGTLVQITIRDAKGASGGTF